MPEPSPASCHLQPLVVRRLGLVDYQRVFDKMRHFTDERTAETPDEIWLLQHPPVFTQGMNGKPEHLLSPGDIPVVEVDRGGQVTYHGPGQLVLYLLLDLRRRKLGVRQVVSAMERVVIDLLSDYGVAGEARQDAPGVYVDGDKVASLGLRVRRKGCYHGLSLNVDMDLEPFQRINPCGYRGLGVTQLRELGVNESLDEIAEKLVSKLSEQLGFSGQPEITAPLPAE